MERWGTRAGGRGWGNELTGEIQIKKGKGKETNVELLMWQMFAHEGKI